jgi:hypothetical protein
LINVDLLTLNDAYQRDGITLDEKLIKDIAFRFDKRKFAPLIVGKRIERGVATFAVADGGHRLRGVRLMNERAGRKVISHVYCHLVETRSVEEEATIFVEQDKNRAPMTVYDRFKGQKCENKDPIYREIDVWLEKNSFVRLPYSVHRNNVISFTGALLRTWRKDAQSAQAALLAQRNTLKENEGLVYEIHLGFWHCARHGVVISKYVPFIKKKGGKELLITEIASAKLRARRTAGGGMNSTLCGDGCLDAINEGKPSPRPKAKYQW